MTAWLSSTLDNLKVWFAEAQERKTRIDRLRAVGALAAGLSHEFATPLNTAQLRLARVGRTHDLAEDDDLRTAIEELERCGDILRHMAGSQLSPIVSPSKSWISIASCVRSSRAWAASTTRRRSASSVTVAAPSASCSRRSRSPRR